MKKLLLAMLVALFASGSAFALPKLAVLDATVAKGVDRAVIGPVTDKVNEMFVKSKRYTVLDRANVQQIFKEKAFQLATNPDDEAAASAGQILGADYIVVIKIDLVTGTYFISAKMLDVNSGAVFDQASSKGSGPASVLVDLAEEVGRKLASTRAEDTTGAKPSPSASPSAQPSGGQSGSGQASGNQDPFEDNPPPAYRDDAFSYLALSALGFDFQLSDGSTMGGGIDAYLLIKLDGPLYLSASAMVGTFEFSSVGTNYTMTLPVYSVGAGLVFPFRNGQWFIGARGNYITPYATDSSGVATDYYSAAGIGAEAGLAWNSGGFVFGLRLEYDYEFDTVGGTTWSLPLFAGFIGFAL
jgi:hypothetical protein